MQIITVGEDTGKNIFVTHIFPMSLNCWLVTNFAVYCANRFALQRTGCAQTVDAHYSARRSASYEKCTSAENRFSHSQRKREREKHTQEAAKRLAVCCTEESLRRPSHDGLTIISCQPYASRSSRLPREREQANGTERNGED